MKSYLANLTRRERLILITGFLGVGLLLGYVLVIEPFQTALDDYHREIPARENDLAVMKQAAQEIIYLRQAPEDSGDKSTSSSGPLSAIDASAEELGLGRSLKRMEPEGKEKVKIWLEEALFDDILRWLSLLKSSYGIKTGEILTEGSDRSGYVDARITLVKKKS